jgi:hypothetical protein
MDKETIEIDCPNSKKLRAVSIRFCFPSTADNFIELVRMQFLRVIDSRVARFFVIQYTKMYQKTTKLPKGHIIYPMAIIYSKRP